MMATESMEMLVKLAPLVVKHVHPLVALNVCQLTHLLLKMITD